MKKLLGKFIDQTIGINFDSPDIFKKAELAEASDAYFTIYAVELKMTFHYPYSSVLFFAEAEKGINTGYLFDNSFPMVVQVMHLKGSTGTPFRKYKNH